MEERLEKDFMNDVESEYDLLDSKFDSAFLGIDMISTKPIYDINKIENIYLSEGVDEEVVVEKIDKELFSREDIIFIDYFDKERVLFSKKLRKLFRCK